MSQIELVNYVPERFHVVRKLSMEQTLGLLSVFNLLDNPDHNTGVSSRRANMPPFGPSHRFNAAEQVVKPGGDTVSSPVISLFKPDDFTAPLGASNFSTQRSIHQKWSDWLILIDRRYSNAIGASSEECEFTEIVPKIRATFTRKLYNISARDE